MYQKKWSKFLLSTRVRRTHVVYVRHAYATCTHDMYTRHTHTTCSHDMYVRHVITTYVWCVHDLWICLGIGMICVWPVDVSGYRHDMRMTCGCIWICRWILTPCLPHTYIHVYIIHTSFEFLYEVVRTCVRVIIDHRRWSIISSWPLYHLRWYRDTWRSPLYLVERHEGPKITDLRAITLVYYVYKSNLGQNCQILGPQRSEISRFRKPRYLTYTLFTSDAFCSVRPSERIPTSPGS